MYSWHSLTLSDLYRTLKTDEGGLTAGEADERLRRFGYNEIRAEKEPWLKRLIEPFKSLFIIILLIAAVFSFVTGEKLDGTIILTIIAINTAIYFSQQRATNRILKSLKEHSKQQIQVLRDGQKLIIDSRLVVPGDVILLNEGQKVPADARLIEEDNLYMDESALTGESLPVKKKISLLGAEKRVYERDNMIYSGTYVTAGSGRAMVVSTGAHTEFGAIAKLAAQKEPKSPLQTKIDQIVSRLIKILAVLAVLVFLLSLLRGIETGEALRFVLSFSVSAVPEDLPIALTVIFVLGMRRMAKRNALVRSIKAIENLGLITTIATDKTGTLTKNELMVAAAWPFRRDVDIKQVAAKALGEKNALEPFDQALEKYSSAGPSGKLIKTYPFNQQQRASGGLWEDDAGRRLYIKGAPEHLLNLCHLEPDERHQAEAELREMVSKGFRVIGLAYAQVTEAPANLDGLSSMKWQLAGLLAFADELRAESAPAIAAAQAAGISVKMITGDHFDTAFHIGRLLKISPHRDQVIQGTELPETEEALEPIVKQKSVFARILPKQKFLILGALQRSEITAMTGDGVNDVPALANSNVGIAMASGSDIAKDTGDIVLLDNNFASIVKAISEGRVIYDNIRKMLFYLFATSLGEVLVVIGALLLGLPLPVTAIMILWVNLVTDTALVIPLGLEPPEIDHMKRPPRHPKEPILDKLILTRIFVVAAAMAISILGYFGWLISEGYSDTYAQTIAFAMLVFSQWVNAFNARSERQSLIRRLMTPNLKIIIGLGLAIVAQAAVMFGPLKGVFGVQTVASSHMLTGVIISGLSVWLAVEVHKWLNRKRAF